MRTHWRWPGPVFSVNPSRRIWPFVRLGYTPEAEREYIDGLSPVIDLVAEHVPVVASDDSSLSLRTRPKIARYSSHRITADPLSPRVERTGS